MYEQELLRLQTELVKLQEWVRATGARLVVVFEGRDAAWPSRPRQAAAAGVPSVTIAWADSAYGGELVEWARTFLNLTIKVISRPPDQEGFVVLPRRWVVERTPSWLLRARHNCYDHERLVQHSEAHLAWAAITLTARRLVRHPAPPASTWPHEARRHRLRPHVPCPEFPRVDVIEEHAHPPVRQVGSENSHWETTWMLSLVRTSGASSG